MRYKILIVEDEPVIASSEKQCIESEFKDNEDVRICIDIVDSRSDALLYIDSALAERKPYDLIIADLNLKDSDSKIQNTNGYKLIKQLSKVPNSPKVIIRSAYSSYRLSKELPLSELLSLGCIDHIEASSIIPKSGLTKRDRIELIGAVTNLVLKKKDSMAKHRTFKYGRLKYSYDKKKWFCDGVYMDRLVFPYDVLLLKFLTNQGTVMKVESIYKYLNNIEANYKTENVSKDAYAKKVWYRIDRLRKILNTYGYADDEIIRTSPRGGYFAMYIH